MATNSVVITPYVHTDYSQWQRRDRSNKKIQTCCHSLPVSQEKPQKQYKKIVKTTDPINIRLLKLQITSKKKSLTTYQEHNKRLQSHNTELITSIQDSDKETHHNVTDSLSKYQKFKYSLKTLQEIFVKDMKIAQQELQHIKYDTNKRLKCLQEKLQDIDNELITNTSQLQVLFNYKEKEYPLKLVQTEQLKVQLEYLQEKHQRDENELQFILEEERTKFQYKMEAVRNRLETQATKDQLSKMQRSVVEKAVHNVTVEKEILLHEKILVQLKRDITILQDKIRLLKQVMKDNPPHELYITSLGRCNPETDIQLDIPKQEQLPV